MDEVELTTFQVEVAHAFFELKASEGYVVAGGAALIASELISRPTQDLDLFTSAPVMSVTAAKESFLKALSRPALDCHRDPRQPDVLSSRRD